MILILVSGSRIGVIFRLRLVCSGRYHLKPGFEMVMEMMKNRQRRKIKRKRRRTRTKVRSRRSQSREAIQMVVAPQAVAADILHLRQATLQGLL